MSKIIIIIIIIIIIVDFSVPVGHRINLEECEMKDNTSTLLEN